MNINQDLRSTAIYAAKIIIFKILPLYIVYALPISAEIPTMIVF